MRRIISIALALGIVITGWMGYTRTFGAPAGEAESERFVVARNTAYEDVVKKLHEEGFVRSEWGIAFALNQKGSGDIEPGGYSLSKAMSAWDAAETLRGEPALVWIVIPEGLRKEQIAELFVEKLGWTDTMAKTWITTDTNPDADHKEGVYFPDTYLIPRNESTADVARRLRLRFEEKFAPYAEEARKQNIRWTTLIKIASLVQREAAGQNDMPLIAGVLWNRLLDDMKLDIDATLQYIRGKTEIGWWAPAKPADKTIDSPFNTYKYKGLPPHPIANPGEHAIEAVLFPEATDCFYYLHEDNGTIHCATTYEEHQENVQRYL